MHRMDPRSRRSGARCTREEGRFRERRELGNTVTRPQEEAESGMKDWAREVERGAERERTSECRRPCGLAPASPEARLSTLGRRSTDDRRRPTAP